MTWTIYKENVLQHLQERLDGQHYSNARHPYLESRFALPLMEVFPHKNEYLAEYEENGKIICAFVMSEFSKFTAASYVDGVSQISLTYIDKQISAGKLEKIIQSLFKALPKFYLAINFELQDPDLTDFEKFNRIRLVSAEICAKNTSIPAGIDFQQYWDERPKKVRKEIARRLRILERDNVQVHYRINNKPELLDESFKNYCRLEGSGWKGREGTALTETNEQGIFYKKIISGFMETGQGKIHELLFDDHVAASLITIENDDMIIVMKTTYDEALSTHSPGRLIDYFMLQSVLTLDNKKNIENYTDAGSIDQKWFPRVRDMYDVTFYRNSLVKKVAELKQKLSS